MSNGSNQRPHALNWLILKHQQFITIIASWYTNPQTEAFTQLLQIPNKVNPVPAGMAPPLMMQGTEGETAGEHEQEISMHTGDVYDASAASISSHREIPSPTAEGEANGEGGRSPLVTYASAQGGGWSPSRIVD